MILGRLDCSRTFESKSGRTFLSCKGLLVEGSQHEAGHLPHRRENWGEAAQGSITRLLCWSMYSETHPHTHPPTRPHPHSPLLLLALNAAM
jgi:hypothetical protein